MRACVRVSVHMWGWAHVYARESPDRVEAGRFRVHTSMDEGEYQNYVSNTMASVGCAHAIIKLLTKFGLLSASAHTSQCIVCAACGSLCARVYAAAAQEDVCAASAKQNGLS